MRLPKADEWLKWRKRLANARLIAKMDEDGRDHGRRGHQVGR